MKQKAEAARRERQQLLAKEAAEKQSTVRKLPYKETALESSGSGRPVTRQSRQGSLPPTSKSSRKSSRKPRKSFDVNEIGGRKISLEVKETDSSDTTLEPPSPSPLDLDASKESSGTPQVGSAIPEESLGSQPEGSPPPKESSGTQLGEPAIPEESLSSQPEGSSSLEESPVTQPDGLGSSEESPGTQQVGLGFPEDTQPDGLGSSEESPEDTQPDGSDTLPPPAQSMEIQSSLASRFRAVRPSYIEPADQTADVASTYVDTPVLQFDSTDSDEQGPGKNASRQASRSSSRHINKTASSHAGRSAQGAEDPHTDSSDGDQNMEMEELDATAKKSMQTAPRATVSSKRPAAKTSGSKRKKCVSKRLRGTTYVLYVAYSCIVVGLLHITHFLLLPMSSIE